MEREVWVWVSEPERVEMLELLLHCELLDAWVPASDTLWEVLETLGGGD